MNITKQVEVSSLDLRYECFRMKSKNAEKILMESILNRGIRDPLQGVDTKNGAKILLDGFKRLRCAIKLGIGIVPWHSFGNDESVGILELLRISNAKSLTILEQARLIDELKTVCNMCNADIALLLEKSTGWVSMRTGIIKEMSAIVMENIFNGKFPVYAYMYTLRRFMRMNCIKKEEIDMFVKSVSGKNLSIRDIETLAHGYFKGSDELRNQINNGNISWGLTQLKEVSTVSSHCTETEQKALRALEITQKYIQRIIYISCDKRFKTASFNAQANLLTGGILRQINTFKRAVRELHDRSGQTKGNILSS
jgi:hypothetical protein